MKFHQRVFQLLVLLLPVQLGYHFWPVWANVYGIRVDYLSPTVFLTDLVILVLLLSWVWSTRQKLFQPQKIVLLPIPILLFAWLIWLNLTFVPNPLAGLYGWLKNLEFLALGCYLAFNWKEIKTRKLLEKPLTLAIGYTGLIALFQFLLQRTIGGPVWFLGERSFTVSTPGIALFSFFGQSFLRAYATFPHPNALAGFVLVALILILVKAGGQKLRKDFWSWVALIFGGIGLILSFSQNAWLAVFLALACLFLKLFKEKGFHRFLPLFVLSVFLFSLALPVWGRGVLLTNFSLAENLQKRLELAVVGINLFLKSPVWGIGLKNFVVLLPETRTYFLETISLERFWQLQPVHNIFLLSLIETGLVGFLAFFFLIRLALKNSVKKDWRLILALIVILITGISDHYWLTLQQNQLLLTLVLAGLYGEARIR